MSKATHNELHLGTLNPECACCRKPFDADIQRAAAVRIASPMPWVSYEYHVCGECLREAKRAEKLMQQLTDRVLSYHQGDEVGK